MLIQPIDIFVYAWLIVAVLSAGYVAWDQFKGNPEPAVMKWGFVLVTLYKGPTGWWWFDAHRGDLGSGPMIRTAQVNVGSSYDRRRRRRTETC